MRKIVVLFSIAVMLFAGCEYREKSSSKPGSVKPYGADTWFVTDPTPEPLGVKGNPLDYAGAKIGLDVRNVELPRGHEGAYRYAARNHTIDEVSTRPLYMKQWTEDNAQRLLGSAANGIGVISDGLAILTGADTPDAVEMSAKLEGMQAFRDSLAKSNFTPRYQEILAKLQETWFVSARLAELGRKDLTQQDIDFFAANPGYYLAPDGKRMVELTGNVDGQFLFLERARKVHFEYIFAAARLLANATDEYVKSTTGLKPTDIYADPARSNEIFTAATPVGLVVVAGYGNDTHSVDAALMIDLGGNDTYENNAGGTSDISTLASLLIDVAGFDSYKAPERNYVQGFGFLGVGLLADLAGDDRYEAKHFCQGAGILGVGAIWDRSGDDRYVAHAFNQGAAMFGLGMLIDGAGEDYYDTATLGQGGATTLGLGILCDVAGDDRYHLAIGPGKDALGSAGYGQGGALSFRSLPWRGKFTAYGGTGFLVDGAGNDRYRTRGWCDQGGSYIMSFGAIYDGGGNDHYSSVTGTGSGIHVTNAIVIDKSGNDIYEGAFRCGGSGGDRSPAFLIDYDGDDTYISSSSNFGSACKPFAYSLLIDYKGNDKYIAPNPGDKILMNNWDSIAGVWPESEPYLWPYGIALDLGGNDDYKVRNRANNMQRHSFGHGLHIDMEWTGGDVIGKIEPVIVHNPQLVVPEALRNSAYLPLFERLNSADNFVRFQAVRNITEVGPQIVEYIVQALLAGNSRAFNRDAMECLHYFLVNGQAGKTEIAHIAKLLQCTDPEVRIIVADDFGVFIMKGAETELMAALTDPEPSVRRYALTSLYAVEYRDEILDIVEGMLNDPDSEVARIAAVIYGRICTDIPRCLEHLHPLLSCANTGQRMAAIAAYAEKCPSESKDGFAKLLLFMSHTPNDYLNRAIGRALAELGYLEGIDILIDSMDFPSIDAFFNYNYNVPNYLAAYTGVDFSDGDRGDRYNPDIWRKWLSENRSSIDLAANVAAYKEFSKLPARPEEKDIPAYEAFIAKYPKYNRAKKAFAALLNSLAWNMITASRDSAAFKPVEGLAYAKRCCELDDDVNCLDTLAEAYEANGMTAEAIALCKQTLEKHPGNGLFTGRLKRLEK